MTHPLSPELRKRADLTEPESPGRAVTAGLLRRAADALDELQAHHDLVCDDRELIWKERNAIRDQLGHLLEAALQAQDNYRLNRDWFDYHLDDATAAAGWIYVKDKKNEEAEDQDARRPE